MRTWTSLGAFVVLLAGCGGVSRIGEGNGNVDDGAGGSGTSSGGSSSTSSGGRPSTSSGGRDPGTAGAGTGEACQADSECGAPEICNVCADGTRSCAQGACQAGRCTVTYVPACGGEQQCRVADDCPQPPPSCNVCADGSYDCPRAECTGGTCSIVSRGCQEPVECRSSAECAVPDLPCPVCPDGTTACATAECQAGVCVTQPGQCGGGGSCDPTFCAGNETGRGCCIGPNGPCGIDTGNGCGRVGDTCASDLDCPVIDADCIPCADGSCTAPKNVCSAGECLLVYPGCVGAARWYATCGDPVCSDPAAPPPPGDVPGVPLPWPNMCDPRSGQTVGSECDPALVGTVCDASLGCGAFLVCSTSDPTAGPGGCPR